MTMTQAEFDSKWRLIVGESFGLPACPDGMMILKAFADEYPRSFEFLRQEDFINLDSDSFVGIQEWKAFTEHVIVCPRCNEV